MPNEETHESRIEQTRAILFDLHHTITEVRTDIISWCRITSKNAGVDLSQFSDEQIQDAFNASNEVMKSHLENNQVDIHWGNDPDDWLEINRIFFNHLNLTDVTNNQIDRFEMGWRGTKDNAYELLIDGAKETLEELSKRGYILGLCTRRHTDPKELLDGWEINHLFETIHYSGVPGYAKPSPYTLLKAADEIGVNPRLCAYVGNLVNADVEASNRAEMFPVLTVWADSHEREQAPDDILVIERITDLLEHFKESPN